MRGLMMDYPLTVTAIMERAKRLFPNKEIVTKAGRNRFPMVISRAAPSCMAISYAEDMGITLVGFARGERMNIYTWPNRIALE